VSAVRSGVPVTLAVGVALLVAPAPARAGGEAWLWTEHQARIVDGDGDVPQTNMRFTTNARFASRSDGLDFGLARLGPVFSIAPWLTTAATGAAVGLRSGNGGFVQEYRGELDLVPHTKLGDLVLSSRNRFEYVWRESGPFTRYRNLLRVAYAPRDAKWIPFAFVDVFLRPTEPHLQETWSALGVGRALGGGSRLDVAYMLRTRDGSGGEIDHVLWLVMFFGVPGPKTEHIVHPVGGHGD
jgi:hypothetical protein